MRHVTSLVLMLKDNKVMNQLLPKLNANIDTVFQIKSWEEMYPNILQQIESDKSSAAVMKAILYMVIMFGILGTVMMMVSERKREFGVMMAIGMTKFSLMFMVIIETLLIAIFSVIAGLTKRAFN